MLHGATLKKVDLNSAILIGASLKNVDLGGFNPGKIKMHRIQLTGSSLNRANLSLADLRDAIMAGGDFTGVDINSVRNIGLAKNFDKATGLNSSAPE